MRILRNLYDWVLSWAHSKYGAWALCVVAFVESSVFPIPPDVLQIALSVSRPKKSFWYALLSSIFSVLGGILGFVIGVYLMDVVGWPVIKFYGYEEQYLSVKDLFQKYDVWAVAIAGFTPIPYKIFTIASGAFDIAFGPFVIASALSRSARFFLVAGLIYVFGPSIKNFIDKYFGILTFAFFALLILGFIAVKMLIS